MTNPGESSITPAPPTTPDPGGPRDGGAPATGGQPWDTPPGGPLVPPSLPSQPAPQGEYRQHFPQPQSFQPPPYPPAQQGPPAYPYAPPAWSPPAPAHGAWAQAQPGLANDSAEAMHKARTALGWAIGAAVGAFLALGIAVVALFMGGAGMVDEGLFYEPMRGEVNGLSEGDALAGDDLGRPLDALLNEWYLDVGPIACPDTASVSASTTVVCTGEVEGMPWTGVVFFEDATGGFVVLEP